MPEKKRWLYVTRSRCGRAMLIVVVKRRGKPALPRSMKQQPSRPYARTPQPSPRSPRPWPTKSADCSRRPRHSRTRKRSGRSIIGRKESKTISQFCPLPRKSCRRGIARLQCRPTGPLRAFYSDAIGSRPVFGRIGTGSFRCWLGRSWSRSSRLPLQCRLASPRLSM